MKIKSKMLKDYTYSIEGDEKWQKEKDRQKTNSLDNLNWHNAKLLELLKERERWMEQMSLALLNQTESIQLIQVA